MNEQIAASCPARTVCKLHQQACDVTCVAYSELQYQLSLSNIPVRYRAINGAPASVSTAYELLKDSGTPCALEYRAAARTVIQGSQKGLYLYSSMTGTGKSTAATALACEYIVKHVGQSLKTGKASSLPLVYYVSMPQFLERVKQMYSQGNEAVMAEVNDIQERMTQAQLLVLDDAGVTVASESVQERLLAVIEQRYDRPTIYTSNCNLNRLEDRLGSRIVSRIYGSTTEIHVKGVDHRRETE